MNQHELLVVVEETWRQLDSAIAGLDEAALVEPGVVESWSIKDLLGHVSAWEQVALQPVERWRRGEAPTLNTDESVNDFNARESARRRDWPLSQVRTEAAETRQRLRTLLSTTGDDEWAAETQVGERKMSIGDKVGGALGGPAGPGTHAAEHAAQIRAWREARAAAG